MFFSLRTAAIISHEEIFNLRSPIHTLEILRDCSDRAQAGDHRWEEWGDLLDLGLNHAIEKLETVVDQLNTISKAGNID